MQTTQPRTNILALAAVITITLTLAADSLYAVWSAPTTNPPDGNVATPIHTGSATQIKGGSITAGEGRIGANQFVAFDKMRAAEYCGLEADSKCVPSADLGGGGAVADPFSVNTLNANTVNSDRYCDENGNNCFWPENINNRNQLYLCPAHGDLNCGSGCTGGLSLSSTCSVRYRDQGSCKTGNNSTCSATGFYVVR